MAFVPIVAAPLAAPRGAHSAVCRAAPRMSFLGGGVARRAAGRGAGSNDTHTPARARGAARWAMSISTNDFRSGTTIELDGAVHRVLEFLHVKPGKGSAFVRTKLRNMKTGNTVDKTFKAGEMVPSAVLDKVVMQHTYRDADEYVFMNMETFEEERMTAKALGETAVKFMIEGLDVTLLKHNDNVLGVEIPKTMSFTVVQTDPGLKGNTMQGGSKPAVIETGAEVMVPLFIEVGQKINVSTADSKYVSRDNS